MDLTKNITFKNINEMKTRIDKKSFRVNINPQKGQYQIHSLEYDEEHGFFIAVDNYYEGHEAGSNYDDLGKIPEDEALRIFNETFEEIENEQE